MAASSGQAPDFLSEDELLEFRGLTNLLRATNGLDDHTQEGGLGVIHDNAKAKNNLLYRRLAEFGDLLVRHYEVVAVSCADKNSRLIQILAHDEGGDEGGDDNVDNVYYTANPDPFRDKKKGTASRVAPLMVEIIAATAEHMVSPGAWLLKHTVGTKRKAPKTDITIEMHGAMLVSLITATHTHKANKEKEETEKNPAMENLATENPALENLNNYVSLASIAKIHGRFIRGTARHRRNLWDFLTKNSTDIHTARRDEKCVPFKPWEVNGTKIPHRLLTYILKSLKSSKTGLAPELEPWLERPNDVEYTTDTRPIFQELLSGVLITLETALSDLVNMKQKKLMQKGKGEIITKEDLELAAVLLDIHAQAASNWLSRLSRLLDQLRPVMKAHLSYLSDVFNLHQVKYENTLSCMPNASLSKMPAYSPSSKSVLYESSSDTGLEDLEDDLEKTTLKENGAYTTDFEEIDSATIQQNWDQAALKYMDLICLHQKAANSLAKRSSSTRNRITFEFLKAASFEYVRCYQDQPDSQMKSMKEVLEDLELYEGEKIGPDDITKIRTFIQDHLKTNDGRPLVPEKKWASETGFDGNFHCETLLLSLQLLYRTQAVHGEIGRDKRDSDLQLPSKDIIDRFANPSKVLPVSKRCCPACHALIKYINTNANGEEKILYPGYHENWFTAALPPWLPRKAGMAVIEAARRKLAARIKTYLKAGSPLSVSSTGTSHISTMDDELSSSSDHEAVNVDKWMEKYYQRKEREKEQLKQERKRKKEEEEEDAGGSPSPKRHH